MERRVTDASATFWLDDVIGQHRSRWFLRRSARAIIQAINEHPKGAKLRDNPSLSAAVHAGLHAARWHVALELDGETPPSADFVVRNKICEILNIVPVNHLA
jgi:hypothetical protein